MSSKRSVTQYITPKGSIIVNKIYKNELFVFTPKAMLSLLGLAVLAGIMTVVNRD